MLCGACNGFLGQLERLGDGLEFRFTAGRRDYYSRVAAYLRRHEREYPPSLEPWASVEQLVAVLQPTRGRGRMAAAARLREQVYGGGSCGA